MAHELLDLIDTDLSVVHGEARSRGTRIPVSVVLGSLAAGITEADMHEQYPSLPAEAARAAVAYAAAREPGLVTCGCRPDRRGDEVPSTPRGPWDDRPTPSKR